VILADRGVGRAEWAAVCQEGGVRSLVRIPPAVTVTCPRDRGVLSQDPVRQGLAPGRHDVPDRQDARGTHPVVIRWRPNLPKQRDEPWDLMTDPDGRAGALGPLYGRRRSVAALSRDQKDRRDGPSLRDPRSRKAERFDRFLRGLARADLLLVGLGLQAERDHAPSAWCPDRRARECRVVTIGPALLERGHDGPEDL
jgi:hypothetical protein